MSCLWRNAASRDRPGLIENSSKFEIGKRSSFFALKSFPILPSLRRQILDTGITFAISVTDSLIGLSDLILLISGYCRNIIELSSRTESHTICRLVFPVPRSG